MKKRAVSLMLSIALLLVLIPPNLAAAADDHANALGSAATFINLNSTVSGVISPNTDVDWFRFSLPAAGTITIASTVSGGLDSYGYLYSSSQSLIASNDDLNGRAFGMSVNLPIGTYYIKVASYNGTSSGSYTLRITGTASSAGTSTPTPATTTSGGSATVSPGTARSITVYSGVTGRVRISTTATVTGTYIFTSSGNGSYDPAAYNSNSSSASRIADDEAGSGNFRFSVNLSAGQAYSFYAGTYGNGAASYVVSVTAPATVYTYTVSYNANGGSGAPASQTKTQNAGLTLSSVRPTRSGYAFLGWSTGSAATSASYQPGGSYTANANVMLYAVWQAQAATSGAMTAIGTGSRSVSVAAGTPTRFAFTPSTTGTYTFSTSSNSGDPYLYLYSSSAMTSAYLLTSNDDISSSDRNSRISYNLNAGVTYYIGAGAYSNGAATYILTISGGSAAVTYTVSYNANGGSGAPASQTKTQNVSLTLSSVRPTRSGYNFLGWSTSSAATSASYQPGGSYTANAGITLYAVWQTATTASTITAIGTGSRTVSVVAGTPTRFAFTPPTTGTYTFSTSSNSGDPYLYLYSSSAMTSAYLLTSNDDYNGSYNSYIQRSLTAGVTYYIGAGAFSNGAATYILTISGTAAAATYTVSYSANGGSGAPAAQTKTQNVSLTLSGVRPTRSGYNFLGWSTSSAATSASYQPGTAFTVNANTTLYAVWQAATVTITWNANGASIPPVSVVKTPGTALGTLPVPARTNYTFAGWFTAASGGTQITASSVVPTVNTIYYARWISTVTITWNANGGSVSPTSAIKQVGTALGTLPTPTRTGYTFNGWYTASSGGTKISASTAVPTGNATYYAQWAIKYVTVMWNSNGGSVSPTSASKQEGTALGTLPTPTRTGYTFNGWYTASSGGAKISTSTIVPSSSVTYYAQWTAKTVTVTWNANGGSASPTSTVKQVGTTLGTLPTPTRTGYTFNGWYTSSSGGTKISASTAVPTGNVTYYAQWAAQNITVTWNANGGNVSPTSIVKTGGTTFGALPTPTRANYTFAGWFTAVSGGTQITVSSAVPLSSTTYYARWTQISITVTWNPNGGSVSPTSASKQAGTTLGILPTPTRTGYTFDGWYTSSSGGTQISASTVAPSSNIMYYAQWSALIPDDYGDTRETAVSINYIDNGVTASGLNVVPFAANVNNPNNVPLGTPIAGNIGYPPGVRDRYDTKDIDYFAFRVPQTASYTIDVFGSSASTLVEGHLYRSDIIAPQEIVAIHYNNHQGGRITQTLNANVVYYLSVRSYQGSYYGDYQLVLNYTYQRTGVSYLDEFLKVAESQLGTVEYNDRAMTVPGTGNYTIYGEWNAEYGSGTGTANPWCVMFMNWCASHAGVPLDVIPWNQTAKSQNLQDWYVAYSRFSAIGELNASNSVTPFRPKAGDLMLFPAHTAIVVADVVNADGISGTTYTIDGNSGNYNNTGEGYRVQYNARNFTIINGVRSYSKQKPNGFAINFGISYGVVPTQYVDNTRSTLL